MSRIIATSAMAPALGPPLTEAEGKAKALIRASGAERAAQRKAHFISAHLIQSSTLAVHTPFCSQVQLQALKGHDES